jgi:uncharacterized protein (DUF952 family)
MQNEMVFHITSHAAWELAEESGEYSSPSLQEEGFIHCSDIDQVAGSANRFFSGRQDLILLHIDKNAIEKSLRYELASEGVSFPHIYGKIPLNSVKEVEALSPDKDGRFHYPPLKDQLNA